jgi:hypothetical protein
MLSLVQFQIRILYWSDVMANAPTTASPQCSDPLETLRQVLKLTDEQFEALKNYVNQQQPKAGPPTTSTTSNQLTDVQTRAFKAEMENYKAAQRKVTDSLGVLWNAQLDFAANVGQADILERALGKPVALWDNCDCGGGGGTACW